MNDEPLIHWGIPGMKWGVRRRAGTARMDKSGNVTISRRGKRVPLMTTVRGKKVQVNGRALSNKTRSFFKKVQLNGRPISNKTRSFFKQLSDLYKQNPKQFRKDFAEQFGKELVNNLKVTRETIVTLSAVYGTIKLAQLVFPQD